MRCVARIKMKHDLQLIFILFCFILISFWKDHLIIICLDYKTQRYENNLFDIKTGLSILLLLPSAFIGVRGGGGVSF